MEIVSIIHQIQDASKYQIGLGTSDGANGKRGDWFELSNNNRTILFGASNANPR